MLGWMSCVNEETQICSHSLHSSMCHQSIFKHSLVDITCVINRWRAESLKGKWKVFVSDALPTPPPDWGSSGLFFELSSGFTSGFSCCHWSLASGLWANRDTLTLTWSSWKQQKKLNPVSLEDRHVGFLARFCALSAPFSHFYPDSFNYENPSPLSPFLPPVFASSSHFFLEF